MKIMKINTVRIQKKKYYILEQIKTIQKNSI